MKREIFVAPALAGRLGRASFHQFVHPSTLGEHNSSYNFVPIIFKTLHVFSSWYEDGLWDNSAHSKLGT